MSRFLRQIRTKGSRWGLIALGLLGAAACVALIAGVSYVIYDSTHGGALSESREDASDRISADVRFPAADYRQSQFPRRGRSPLIGVNYTHHDFPGCDPTGTGILRNLHKDGVFKKVHGQLLQMRRNGINSLRTIVWHLTDASQEPTGSVSSAAGRLREPYRTNLIRYLTEVRKFGFERLTIVFGPQGTNNPILDTYEQSKFEENWHFIRDLRPLLKRYGPRDTRIDLLNEGAPSSYMPVELRRQLETYIGELYDGYDAEFGAHDVTVSVIAPRRPRDMGARLQQLVNILRVNGLPQPRWYDIHVGYTAEKAAHGISDSDLVLTRNGRRQPLVIGETAYNDRPVAGAIRDFIRQRSRRIDEVSPWYITREKGCRISPPYAATSYRAVLGTPSATP